jgi:hypothetical protein
MRSVEYMEITTLGSSSWMPYAPQGVKCLDDGGGDDCSLQSNYSLIIHPP